MVYMPRGPNKYIFSFLKDLLILEKEREEERALVGEGQRGEGEE